MHGSQCGFCTPGFVMSMYSLLRSKSQEGKPITEADIEMSLGGNLWSVPGPSLSNSHLWQTCDNKAMGPNGKAPISCSLVLCTGCHSHSTGHRAWNDMVWTWAIFSDLCHHHTASTAAAQGIAPFWTPSVCLPSLMRPPTRRKRLPGPVRMATGSILTMGRIVKQMVTELLQRWEYEKLALASRLRCPEKFFAEKRNPDEFDLLLPIACGLSDQRSPDMF